MEIIPGLHRISGRMGGMPTHAYLVLGPEPLLVDTGMPGQAQRILDYLSGLGLPPQALRHIVLTHHDVDHIGSAEELRRRTGARVYAHRLDARCIAGLEPRRPFLKRLTAPRQQGLIFAVDQELEGGEVIAGWEVIHTPGHSAGSISLYRAPTLLVGDLLRTSAEGCREMWGITMQDRARARESIRQLAAREVDLLLCGHGEPLRGASAALAALIASWGS